MGAQTQTREFDTESDARQHYQYRVDKTPPERPKPKLLGIEYRDGLWWVTWSEWA